MKDPELEIKKKINDSYEIPNNVVESAPYPLVSIRTSAYNHSAYIRQCIEGVLSQKTSFPIEYIIGEDYSSDGTREIVFEYAQKYPNIIRVVTADYNVGMSANGRRCIEKCRGKYMAICEGDDYWIDPYKLQKQVDFLESNPEYSMCFHNVNVVAENCNLPTNIYSHLEDRDYNIIEILERWTIPTCSVLYRNYINKYIPINNKFTVGDNVIFTTCFLYGKIRCMNSSMGCYRRNPTGWTNAQYDIIPKRMLQHYDAMVESFPQVDKRIFKRVKATHMLGLTSAYFKMRDKRFFLSLYEGIKVYGVLYICAIIRQISIKLSRYNSK